VVPGGEYPADVIIGGNPARIRAELRGAEKRSEDEEHASENAH
jgi:hypothetical protein